MKLLFISPDKNDVARAKTALKRHNTLRWEAATSLDEAGALLRKQKPQVVVLATHPHILRWFKTLTATSLGQLYVLLVEDEHYRQVEPLTTRSDVVCLAPADLEGPHFPRLLSHLATSAEPYSIPQAGEPGFGKSLRDVTASLTASLDLDTVLDRMLVALLDLVRCDAADIRLVRGDEVRVHRTYGFEAFSEEPVDGLRYSLEATRNLREAAETHHSIVVRDTRRYEGWILQSGMAWIRSQLTVPLFLGGELIGFIDAASATPNAFRGQDIESLETLAHLAAIAIHNAQLYEAEQAAREALVKERDQLLALANIDQQILGISDSPEQAILAILDHALTLMQLSKGVIAVAPYGGRPEFVYSTGLRDPEATRDLILTHWQDESGYPTGRSASNEVPVEPKQFRQWAHAEDVKAVLTVPLWLQGRLVGRILLLDDKTRAWSKREVQIAQMLANQAAIAIDKAVLMQKLRHRLRETETLNRLLHAASTTLDPEDILRSVCDEVKKALRVPLVSAKLLNNGRLRLVGEARDPFYPKPTTNVISLDEAPQVRELIGSTKTRIFADLEAEAPKPARSLFRPVTCSALLTPLTMRDATVGLLQVESPVERVFTEDEARIVRLMAAAITPTLENAWLFQQVAEARAQTEEAYDQLRRLDAVKGQFIQNVSHELRTPLAIVKGYVDLIVEGALVEELDPMLSQAIEAIHTHTNHLVGLVESITTLEDSSVGSLEMMPQSIYPICQAAIKANWQKALRRQVEIVNDVPERLPAVSVDATYMLRALNHVLDNAVKFNKKGGHIWVKGSQRDGQIWLQIEDEGIGIPKTELDRIFDRFYQVDGTTTRRHGGMGLGLSLVREVITRHKGQVWAESHGKGKGTTITISLPVHENREAT
jgi:signal transduction histidine kinase